MNKLLFCFFWLLCGCLAQAQNLAGVAASSANSAESTASQEARQAERERLSQRRQKLEQQEQQDNRACYQKFDVNDCKADALDRRLQVEKVLRKDELKFNQEERRIKAEEARQRRADNETKAAERALDAQRAQQDSLSRQQHQTEKLSDHAAQGQKRALYDEKQRDAEEHRRSIEARIRERDKPRSAPLPLPAGSSQ